jgi:hypothetical protein
MDKNLKIDNLHMSNISSMYLCTMAKKGIKKEEEKEKKKFEQEEMKEEAHQLELKSQYEIDEEDEELMD